MRTDSEIDAIMQAYRDDAIEATAVARGYGADEPLPACPRCGGSGAVDHGRRTPSGFPVYATCPTCDGTGHPDDEARVDELLAALGLPTDPEPAAYDERQDPTLGQVVRSAVVLLGLGLIAGVGVFAVVWYGLTLLTR